MTAAVVTNRFANTFGQPVEITEHLVDRPSLELGAAESCICLVHVGLMVLVVVEQHRLLVDVWFKRVGSVGERGNR